MNHNVFVDDTVMRGGEFNKGDNEAKIEVTTAEMRVQLEADGTELPDENELTSLSKLCV